MTESNLLKSLCIYDPRNPQEPEEPRNEIFTDCYCTNCLMGRSSLAATALRYREVLSQLITVNLDTL